jgi:ABC-type amino acid transport substrate-binding protein
MMLLLAFLFPSCMASMQGKHLTVTTILRGEPYLSLVPDHAAQTGNAKYEGYLLDLVTVLADRLNFDFTLSLVGDGRYGTYDQTTGQWTGMIGEVMYGAADMAVVDMTITSARERVVDFSVPFMHVGITALYKNTGRHVSLDDLLQSPNIQLGVFCCGSSAQFFKSSQVAAYQQLYQAMLSDPAGLPVSNAAGVSRVRAGGYAYFLESSSAEYHTSTDCGLVTVGGLLDSKGHGIVLPQGSENREELNLALLTLREEGVLDSLKAKWWNSNTTCKAASAYENLLQTFWNVVSSL